MNIKLIKSKVKLVLSFSEEEVMRIASSYFYFKLRFKLPRNQYYFCSRSNIGNLIQAGLPNITGTLVSRPLSGTGAGCITYGTGCCSLSQKSGGSTSATTLSSEVVNGDIISIDASRSNLIHDNSSTVQPYSIGCYLMFYAN